MRMLFAATMLMVASLAAAACGGRPRAPDPLPVDHVECARCGMLISTERGAADRDGRALTWQDVTARRPEPR